MTFGNYIRHISLAVLIAISMSETVQAAVDSNSINTASTEVLFSKPSRVTFSLVPTEGLDNSPGRKVMASGLITLSGGGRAVIRWTPGWGIDLPYAAPSDNMKAYTKGFRLSQNDPGAYTLWAVIRVDNIDIPSTKYVLPGYWIYNPAADNTLRFDITTVAEKTCCVRPFLPGTYAISLDAGVWYD